MSRVLVTGGGGFLGSHLVERLERDGHDVFTARRLDYDLTRGEDAERMFRDADAELVFHLAAEVGGIGANRANPGRFWFANLQMGLNVLEQARLHETPKLVLSKWNRRELRVCADGADDDELGHALLARELEHMRPHHQVRVPEAAGVRAVRADAADLGREVEDELGVGVAEHALGVLAACQVVVDLACGDDVVAVALEPLDEVRAEEPAAAGDQDPAHLTGALCCALASQSTRPIHLSRFAAYQAIVRATPSSHETSGSQPVSRASFS